VITIVILAMVAAFVALRLYTVLGRRTGAEQQPMVPTPADDRVVPLVPRAVRDAAPEPVVVPDQAIGTGARDGLRAIVAADSSFDAGRFLDGAKSAYRQTLEAYWAGDEATLKTLADDDVRAAFAAGIAARAAEGHVVDNRLVSIERASIEEARMDGQVAVVTVRFDADIAAVTRDADGNVVAGSMTDAVPTHDLWTFSRPVRATDPNWLLVETDDVE
jgi:predicted lipid-binding transport protein (Tim44 family)